MSSAINQSAERHGLSQAEIVRDISRSSCSSHEDQEMLVVSTSEAMNPRCRSSMEDRAVIHAPGAWGAPDPNLTYLGIYDGHGGRDIVDYLEHGLSYHVAQELRETDVAVETRLVRAFLMADIHSHQAGVRTSGAAVVICLINRDPSNPAQVEILTANAGDSRAVWSNYHQENCSSSPVRLSRDHRVTDPLEMERIQKAGGFIFKGRVMGILGLTRSLGDHYLKEFVVSHPYVNRIQVDLGRRSSRDSTRTREFVILACDGLFDVMSDYDAVELVRNFPGHDRDAAQHLVKEALKRGTTDNITVTVAFL